MCRALQRQLLRGERGTAMIEFALIAPVLILLVFGVTDVAMTALAKVKSSNATVSAADLTTQSINLQTSDMASIFAGAADVMAPFSNSGLVLRITSVASDGNGNAFVHWSCGEGALSPLTAKSTVTTLANGSPVGNILNLTTYSQSTFTYNGKNTSFIQVESIYTYTAPTGFLLPGPQTMTDSAYVYPRQSAYVGFVWDGIVNDQPTAPASATKVASVTLSNGAACSYAQ